MAGSDRACGVCSPAVLPWAVLIGETASKPLSLSSYTKFILTLGRFHIYSSCAWARHATHRSSSSAAVTDRTPSSQKQILGTVLSCREFFVFKFCHSVTCPTAHNWISALCYRFYPQRFLYKFMESALVHLLNCNTDVFLAVNKYLWFIFKMPLSKFSFFL